MKNYLSVIISFLITLSSTQSYSYPKIISLFEIVFTLSIAKLVGIKSSFVILYPLSVFIIIAFDGWKQCPLEYGGDSQYEIIAEDEFFNLNIVSYKTQISDSLFLDIPFSSSWIKYPFFRKWLYKILLAIFDVRTLSLNEVTSFFNTIIVSITEIESWSFTDEIESIIVLSALLRFLFSQDKINKVKDR